MHVHQLNALLSKTPIIRYLQLLLVGPDQSLLIPLVPAFHLNPLQHRRVLLIGSTNSLEEVSEEIATACMYISILSWITQIQLVMHLLSIQSQLITRVAGGLSKCGSELPHNPWATL